MIIFASADRYQALQELVIAHQKYLPVGKYLQILDMTGERLSLKDSTKRNATVSYFNHSQVADKIWQILNPHALDWWRLLSLENKDSLELPGLPGIEDLTKVIHLAQTIDQLESHEVLIVILPPPLHAIKLLQMSQKGPDLIEQLLDPLLNWWDTTRKSLSAVEKMLRLNLPSSEQLRLTENWKKKFEKLQTISTARNKHNFIAFLDQESKNFDQLQHRFSTFALHGTFPTHVVIQDEHSEILEQIKRNYEDSPLTIIKWSNERLENCAKALLKDPCNKKTILTNQDKKSIHLFLPGVKKDVLKIKQTSDSIHLLYHGNHRSIVIPEKWRALRCKRAQMESAWLTLSFLG